MSWPCWTPGLELSAQHLVALEDYVLERSRYIDNSFGVVNLEYHHLSIVKNDEEVLLKLEFTRGLTPSGQPVQITSDQTLTHLIPDEGGEFDAWVCVNPNQVRSRAPDLCQKFTLLLEKVSLSGQIRPVEFPDRLYIGRYSIDNHEISVINRPIPLFLAGLTPHDEVWNWHEWTQELPKIIEDSAAAVRRFADNHPDVQFMASAIFGELVLLGIDWPQEPISRLVRRLYRIQYLSTALFQKQDFITKPILHTFDTYLIDMIGDDLPHQLAVILQPIIELESGLTSQSYPEIGSKVILKRSKKVCLICKSLGEDAAGNRYLGRVESSQVHLCWYRDSVMDDERYLMLETLIERGPPSEHFLWPLDLVHSQGNQNYGYISELEKIYWKPITHAFKSNTFDQKALTAGINIIQRFQELHKDNLCFVDFSLDDVLINDTAQILILFNDNIGHGANIRWQEPHGWDFLAPELEDLITPADNKTDLWTISIVIFWLFFTTLPFRSRTNKDNDFDPFSKVPHSINNKTFLFDPNFDNTDIETWVLNRWQLFPKCLRDAFHQTFVTGRSNPEMRLREEEWLERLARTRDTLFYCDNIKCQQVAFHEQPNFIDENHSNKCISCGEELVLPPRFKIAQDIVVMLHPTTKIFEYHFRNYQNQHNSPIIATVVRDPKSEVLGLINRSHSQWKIHYQKGKIHYLKPGHAWPLDKEHLEATVEFGLGQGTIKALS